jgi:hypothetical protein
MQSVRRESLTEWQNLAPASTMHNRAYGDSKMFVRDGLNLETGYFENQI